MDVLPVWNDDDTIDEISTERPNTVGTEEENLSGFTIGDNAYAMEGIAVSTAKGPPNAQPVCLTPNAKSTSHSSNDEEERNYLPDAKLPSHPPDTQWGSHLHNNNSVHDLLLSERPVPAFSAVRMGIFAFAYPGLHSSQHDDILEYSDLSGESRLGFSMAKKKRWSTSSSKVKVSSKPAASTIKKWFKSSEVNLSVTVSKDVTFIYLKVRDMENNFQLVEFGCTAQLTRRWRDAILL